MPDVAIPVDLGVVAWQPDGRAADQGRWWRGVRIVVCWVHQAGCLPRVNLLVGTAAVLAAAVWMATAGVSVTWCLLIVTLAPAVTVVGHEALGYRHLAAILNHNLARS